MFPDPFEFIGRAYLKSKNIRNLCSGFSYCLRVLETIYVWYGRGSLESERTAALAYGHSLGEDIVEVYEGQSDGAEMFWMILGDDAFANANYWQWRPSAVDDDVIPRVWVISEQKVCVFFSMSHRRTFVYSFFQIKPVEFMNVRAASDVVQLVDCVWELFVVVGSEARAQRRDIRIALHAASVLALQFSILGFFSYVISRNSSNELLSKNPIPLLFTLWFFPLKYHWISNYIFENSMSL